MHGLCGLRSNKYDSSNWKQALMRERIPKKFVKKVKIWHLLQGITLWMICIEHHDKCSTMKNGMSPKLITSFGTFSLCTPSGLGEDY